MKTKIIAVIIMLSAAVFSQNIYTDFYRAADFKTGFSYQTWSAGDETVTESVIPLNLVLPLSQDLTVTAGSNTVFAGLTSADESLNGLTDTRITGFYTAMDKQLLLTAGITLPTGKTRLEGDQSSVASAIAVYPLGFRVPSFGQGMSFSLSGVYAFKTGNFILGTGLGLIYKGGFKPFKSYDVEYKPGMEFSLNFGGETKFGGRKGMRFTFDLTYTLYGADKYGGEEFFKSGNKFIANLRGLFKAGNTDFMIFLRERTKGRNEKGIGSLTQEEKNSNGNQLEFGGMSLTPFSSSFKFKGLLELKLHSKNEYESNGAFIFGLGAGFVTDLSKSISLDVLAKYSTGSLKNKSVSTTVTGFEIGGGLTYTF